MRGAATRDVLAERGQDADRILERVPARDLHDDRQVRHERLLLQHLRPPLDPPWGAVGARERRIGIDVIGEHPRGRHDRERLLASLLGVLRCEGVDRRADHGDPIPREPLPRESRSREYEHVRIQNVTAQEVPGLACALVGGVDTHVTAPHDGCSRLARGRRQAGRLRIVQDHHVLGMHQPRELLRARRQRRLVDLALGVAERAAVPHEPVQAVVDPLRDRKELGLARDHRPSRVDPGAATVTQQWPEHLDHPAALGGRVHVPDHATV